MIAVDGLALTMAVAWALLGWIDLPYGWPPAPLDRGETDRLLAEMSPRSCPFRRTPRVLNGSLDVDQAYVRAGLRRVARRALRGLP